MSIWVVLDRFGQVVAVWFDESKARDHAARLPDGATVFAIEPRDAP